MSYWCERPHEEGLIQYKEDCEDDFATCYTPGKDGRCKYFRIINDEIDNPVETEET